jgi:putative copper export protein
VNILQSFITQITLGKLLAYQVIVALLVFIFSNLIKKNGGALALLILALSGIAAPLFQSHSSSQGSHSLAIGSLVIHVIALSFWIGSVIALKIMPSQLQTLAFSRVSIIALWSSMAVVLTGFANAWTRLGLSQDWFTGYGALISLKIVLTLFIFII